MVKHLLIVLALILPCAVNAQMVITNNGTAATLMSNITGTGISASNPTLSCPTNAYGRFNNGGPANLGLDSGIVLTSGDVSQVGASSSAVFMTGGGSGAGYPLLTSSSAGCNSGFDACVLEFDLVASCDTIDLKLIFASEEYNNFVGSSFNDVFGFYISGVNPSGGNYTNFNMGTVPGTATPITINTINNGTNAAYYVDNTVAAQPIATAYNGLTTVILSRIAVVPGSPYHLILAIQDCSDGSYDSGVFLEYDGISCPDTSLVVSSTETTICEGDAVTLMASGLTNYTWTPAGSTNPGSGPFVTVSPTTTTTYTVSGTNIIGTAYVDSITIFVNPAATAGAISVTNTPTPGSHIICQGDSVQLNLNGHDGSQVTWLYSTIPNQWNTLVAGTAADSIISTGALGVSTVYQAIVANGPCSDTTAPVTVTVVPTPQPAVAGDTICAGDSTLLFASGGGSYSWGPPYNISDTNISNPKVYPTATTTYYVSVTNQWGCRGKDSALVVVHPKPTLSTASLPAICPDPNGSIQATGAGAATLTYSLNGAGYQSSGDFTGLYPGNYTVYVKDGNGCITPSNVSVGEIMDINADFTASDLMGLIPFTVNFTNTSTGNVSTYWWDFGNTSTSTATDGSATYEAEGVYTITLTAYGSDPRCLDTAMITILAEDVSEISVPNVFTPNGDGNNDLFTIDAKNLLAYAIKVFDRWGKVVYESTDPTAGWNGDRKSGGAAATGTYYCVIEYTTNKNLTSQITRYITLLR